MEILIIAVLIGLIPAYIANKKGRSFLGWWFYGILLFIFALPHSLLLNDDKDSLEERELNNGMKKCPYCAELIKQEAQLCRYCGKELNSQQILPNNLDTNFTPNLIYPNIDDNGWIKWTIAMIVLVGLISFAAIRYKTQLTSIISSKSNETLSKTKVIDFYDDADLFGNIHKVKVDMKDLVFIGQTDYWYLVKYLNSIKYVRKIDISTDKDIPYIVHEKTNTIVSYPENSDNELNENAVNSVDFDEKKVLKSIDSMHDHGASDTEIDEYLINQGVLSRDSVDDAD